MRAFSLLCLTVLTAWACLAQGAGLIAESIELPGAGAETLSFQAPPTPAGKIAVLHFRGRLMTEQHAGHCPAVRVEVNGRELDGSRLVNKPREFEWGIGRLAPWWGGGFRLMYSPDFEGNNQEGNPYYVRGGDAYTFELDISDLLRTGENEVKLWHARSEPDFRHALIEDVRLVFRDPAETVIGDTGPPTGELPFIAPDREQRAEYQLAVTPGGGIIVTVGGRDYAVSSAFSHEGGGWNTMSATGDAEGESMWRPSLVPSEVPTVPLRFQARGADYTLTRAVTAHEEYVSVEDTIRNRSGRDLALLQRHEVEAADLQDLYLGGLHPVSKGGVLSEPANPTVLVMHEGSQLGLMAADDVLRIHADQFCEEGRAGLRDYHGALAAGARQTYRWELYPSAQTGYFRMVNAIRRVHGTNFTIPGGFAFINPREPFTTMSDQELGAWLDAKHAKIVGMSISVPKYHGKYTHGTAFLLVDHTPKREFAERIRRIRPGTTVLVYFHSFISTEDEAPQKYAADRILAPDGTQRVYSEDIYPMFLPLADNEYGQKMREYVAMILNECGADGVYWDEMSQSRWAYHYGEPWDGLSADVDRERLTISRKKSAVSLITQPFRQEVVSRLLAEGIPLIGNGNPLTTSMMKYHFPRFIETGSLSNLVRGQLYSPIALGDHLSERTTQHCVANMRRCLDYGAVYYFYHDQVTAEYPSLTERMFPCTPIELGNGYLIAEERILTNRSGNFGWGDDSEAEVYVYGPDGREAEFEHQVIEKDGARYVELRMPRDYMAALVRR